MRRRGALDGIRGLALVAVLAYHSLPEWVPGGWLGVDVFFVLSGYLLASILLEHHRETGRVGWRQYAERRVRRLAPALLALTAAVVVLARLFAYTDAHRLPGDVVASFSGLMNWHLIADQSSYFGQLGRPSLLRHVWSLAIEIQFYVVCPLVVAWLARRRRWTAVATLALPIALSTGALALLWDAADPSRAYFGTDARIGAPLVGVLLAVVTARWSVRRIPAPIGIAAALGLLALFALADDTSRAMYPLGFLAAELAAAVLVLTAVAGGVVARVFAVPPMRWLGLRSYGIYLWHWPLVALLRSGVDVTWSPAATAAVTTTGAVVLGALSYRFVERPFLKSKVAREWWVDSARWAVAGAAIAGVGLLTAYLPRTDPITASIRDGETIVAAQAAVTTTTVAVTTTTAPTAPPPSVVAPVSRPVSVVRPKPAPPRLPPGPAPGTVTVAAIGDSVMLGAARELQARLGATGYIDATVSRQFTEARSVAARLRAEGRLGEVVVVHLGTNGPPRNNDVDALMGELRDVPHVLFLTVRMPRRWEAQSNDVLRSIPGRYANAQVVDWYAHSAGHGEYFGSDGVHLTHTGAQAYAALVGSSLPPPPPPPPPPTTTSTTLAPPPETTTTSTPETTTTTASAF